MNKDFRLILIGATLSVVSVAAMFIFVAVVDMSGALTVGPPPDATIGACGCECGVCCR